MKASISITDTIGPLIIILIVILFFVQIIPNVFGVIIETFSKASAENVARQLSSLITVSGAATYKAELNYTPTKEVVYHVLIASRSVKVTPKIKVSYADKSSNTQPFGVNLGDREYFDVNYFLVKKSFLDGASFYDLQAKKQ